MNKTLIFDFNDLSDKDKTLAKAKRYFEAAGAEVTSLDVDAKVGRTMGFSFRTIQLGFADSQTVVMSIKATGDVYQVKLNGRLLPLKNQDDHVKAIAEIVGAMAKGRAKFQAALAKVKVTLPKGIRTAAPKMEQTLREQITAVDEAIGVATERLATLRAAAPAST